MPEITDYFFKSQEGESATPPNMESHQGDKVPTGTHVRISGVPLERAWEYFQGSHPFLLISNEISKGGQQHLHCLFEGQFYRRDKISNEFREGLVDNFKLKGNGSYSISKIKDNDNAVSYVLKEGTYKYQGYSSEYIEKRKKVSYLKYSKEAIAKDLEECNKRFISGQISDVEWMMSYIDIKHSYNQFNINPYRLKELCDNLKMKRSREYQLSWVTSLLTS